MASFLAVPKLGRKRSYNYKATVDQATKDFLEREKELYEDQNFLVEEDMEFNAVVLRRQESIKPADLQAWEDKRTDLIHEANKTHFSNDIELSKLEIKAEKKLFSLRK